MESYILKEGDIISEPEMEGSPALKIIHKGDHTFRLNNGRGVARYDNAKVEYKEDGTVKKEDVKITIVFERSDRLAFATVDSPGQSIQRPFIAGIDKYFKIERAHNGGKRRYLRKTISKRTNRRASRKQH